MSDRGKLSVDAPTEAREGDIMRSLPTGEAADIAVRIAETLRGTSMSLLNALEDIEREDLENSDAFCATLDSLVFCCERCDWWHEQSEMAEGIPGDPWICESCGEDE